MRGRTSESCYDLVNGTSFRAAAALSIAGFFDDLAEDDMIRDEIWERYSEEFEVLAFDEMNKTETDHFIFVLLNIPLSAHDDQSILQLALEKKRVNFLNHDRIATVMRHMYRKGDLLPDGQIEIADAKYSEMLRLLVGRPLSFYFSAQGYHWVSGILFMSYWMYVLLYASYRPLSEPLERATYWALEVTLWSTNAGYIGFEGVELFEKGLKEYFNLGVKGQTNGL